MTQDRDSLLSQTLRALRLKASELGVPLYSRKSKADLAEQILIRLNKKQFQKNIVSRAVESVAKSSLKPDSIESTKITTKVVFLPRDPQWSYVFWELSESDRKKALSQGASRLCLRLLDVTDNNEGSNKQMLQEILVDSHVTEWYLPIPLSDRDYKVNLGYQYRGNWISLANSSSARVPSLYPSDQILDQFVPFSLEGTSNSIHDEKTSTLSKERDSGLHERLYQVATTNYRKTRIGSEEYQEGFSKQNSFNESGSGFWASGRNESGIGGVLTPERTFWLVADSELVLYGATDVNAKLTIGGEEVPLSSDGTFRLQVPFRDGVQKYPIEATDLHGDQRRNITMQFERNTPQDNTNPSDHAQSEWF